jgi:peptide/nickel transport system ATP-binding protein
VTAALEVDNLRTHIRLRGQVIQAVDGVSLHVNAGETVGLVGESGCGKTMTGLSTMRLLPTGGHIVDGAVRVGGRDVLALSEPQMCDVRGNDIAMIFQDPMTSLNPTMTVGDQIIESIRLHRDLTRSAATARATETLALVGMPQPRERLGYYPHQLSGGLRQRVMIAMALACDPKVLIADEPTTALDVTIQAQILALLDTLKSELGMAILLITHDMGVVAGHADRVVVMYAGRIVDEAATSELFDHVRHPYTEALLASIPRPDQDQTHALFSIPGRPPDLASPPTNCRFEPRCRHATDLCRRADPPLGGDPTHRFACFHPVSDDTAQPATIKARGMVVHARPSSRDAALASDAAIAPILIVENMTKEFPVAGAFRSREGTVKAVSDVSFAIRRGETLGLVGESGCGKTTIGRMLVGLEPPTAGDASFDGIPITELSRRGHRRRPRARALRRDLQLMFQDPYSSLDPRMRIGSILREPMAIQGLGTRSEQKARVASLLDEVGLSPHVDDMYPHEFSGGQRQRVGLARALALQPKLLVADEPVSALDVSVRSQILNLMRDMQTRYHLTYLLISHDLAVVRYMADRIGVMYLGKLVEIGGSTEVIEHPAHPYTAGLIQTMPNPDPRAARGSRAVPVRGELPSAIDPPSGCRFRTRCPLAQRVCSEIEPPLVAFGPDHFAACHFPLQTPTRAM